ncbi:MAG: 3-phosphoshikimate 1-carboxyvinyltransferase, partial [Candidatus Methylomirabilota bacterium]
RGIVWTSPVASAQVKSALLVAGIQASGETTLREPVLSRDHTERMLEAFGVPLRRAGATVRVAGGRPLRATRLAVPGDLSSAAFLLAAAATRPGGEVIVRDVGVNPTRTGFLEILTRMGADVRLGRERVEAGEPVADVTVRGGRLRGTNVQAAEIPALVDEIPILAVTALFADGETCIRGAGELRVKEVDRLAALEGELGRLGAAIRADGDALIIQGGRSLVGAAVSSRGDHRMAMSLAVAALQAAGETRIADVGCVETSFPGFADALRLVAPECGLRDSARHA